MLDKLWSAPYRPIPRTEQDFIILREWARKKAIEMFAGTEIGKRMAWLINSKQITKRK